MNEKQKNAKLQELKSYSNFLFIIRIEIQLQHLTHLLRQRCECLFLYV